MSETVLASVAVVFLSAVVKGAVGFGFPTLATPLLALFIDVKVAVVVLIVPNIVMDGFQFFRAGVPYATVRRLALLLPFGALGTVLGTRLLVLLSSRTVTLILGGFILLFVLLHVSRFAPRVAPRWERWLAAPVGLGAGILGGLTNVPGTPLVMYFYTLGMTKQEFVSAVAFTFSTYKLMQLGTVAYYGLLTWTLLGVSAGLIVVALAAFALGLHIQDRLEQRTFNRVVLAFLAVLGSWLVARALG